MEKLYSLQAERSVLSSVLIEPNSIADALDLKLVPGDFYDKNHSDIFDVITRLYDEGSEVSYLTVIDRMQKKGTILSVDQLVEILGGDEISSAHIYNSAKIVKERAMARSIIQMGRDVADLGKEYLTEPDMVMDSLEKKLLALSQETVSTGFSSIANPIKDLLRQLSDPASAPGTIQGLSTGYKSLDSYLLGMKPGQMIILAARPSVGKTSLGLNIVQGVVRQHDVPVAVISLEMTKTELVGKLIASEGEINLKSLQTKNFLDHELRRLNDKVAYLNERQIYIDDQAGQTIFEMKSKLRKLKMEKGLKFVMIDYLGLIKPHSKYSNKADQVGEISMAIKALAKELEVPILVLAQLNREAEKGDGNGKTRPALHHLRDSGSLEQDADIVMFIDRHKEINPTDATLFLAKNRGGELGDSKLTFLGQYSTFKDGRAVCQ